MNHRGDTIQALSSSAWSQPAPVEKSIQAMRTELCFRDKWKKGLNFKEAEDQI